MKPQLIAILALLGLQGCTTVEDPFLDGIAGAEIETLDGNRELPVQLASASLTGLGEPPLSLRQTNAGDNTKQVMAWANTTTIPGENTLTLSTATSGRSTPQRAPDRAGISRTLRNEFPGVAMSIDPLIRRNLYGSYGVATGKLGDKGGCVYAWQMIDRDGALGRKNATQVRFRFCHATLGPDVLADLLSGLSLRSVNAPLGPTAGRAYGYGYAGLTSGTKTLLEPATTNVEATKTYTAASVGGSPQNEEKSQSGSAISIPMPQ